MKIQEKDWFHGAALTQITEHESFTALNKACEKYGHYQVNHDKRILVKHSSSEEGSWQFTFQPDDIFIINDDIASDQDSHVCLVCGYDTICILDGGEIQEVLDLENNATQWVSVKYPKGGSMRVRGSYGNLKRTIRHNSFPNNLFG